MNTQSFLRAVAGITLIVSLALTASPAVHAQQDGGGEEALMTLQSISNGFNALSRRVSPSVVQIFATGYVPSLKPTQAGQGLLSRQRSTGSGVILDPNGYIVTNAHVVQGATRIEVLLANDPSKTENPNNSILKQRGTLVGAQLVGYDLESDIAVIKIEGQGYPTLEIGDSEELRQGQIVFAFGAPLGLENSVSMGVVSATARQLEPEAPMIYIQTDAVINPGNSGGPLIDPLGRVVGINTFILSQSGGSEGLGFAVPSNIVNNVYGQIRTTGRVRRGLIGTHVQTVTHDLADALALSRDWGVVIADVMPNSPAEKAGLQIGDIVTHMNGKVMGERPPVQCESVRPSRQRSGRATDRAPRGWQANAERHGGRAPGRSAPARAPRHAGQQSHRGARHLCDRA